MYHKHINEEDRLVKLYLDREQIKRNISQPRISRIIKKTANDVIEHLAEKMVSDYASEGISITLEDALKKIQH